MEEEEETGLSVWEKLNSVLVVYENDLKKEIASRDEVINRLQAEIQMLRQDFEKALKEKEQEIEKLETKIKDIKQERYTEATDITFDLTLSVDGVWSA